MLSRIRNLIPLSLERYLSFGAIRDLIIDLLSYIGGLAKRLFNRAYDGFLGLAPPENVIVVNFIAAFFAILLPVAKFYIFENYLYLTAINISFLKLFGGL